MRFEYPRDAEFCQDVSSLWRDDGVWLVLADEEKKAHDLPSAFATGRSSAR